MSMNAVAYCSVFLFFCLETFSFQDASVYISVMAAEASLIQIQYLAVEALAMDILKTENA